VAYATAAACVLRRRATDVPASLTLLVLSGLPLLLWFNAGFKGWNGGWVVGPRYLSPVVPLMGLYVALVYDRLGARVRALLWLTLIPALVLRVLIFAGPSPYLHARSPVWGTFWSYVVSDPLGIAGLRTLFLVTLLLLATSQAYRLSRRGDPQADAIAAPPVRLSGA
jgi:hypothetical protein